MPSRVRVVTAWPLATALVFLSALLVVLGRLMLQATGGHLVYPLDDTYIQMAMAKTLAFHGVWGVTRFEFSSPGSSLLWPPLLALIDRVVGLDERAPLIVNVVAAVALVALAFDVLRRHVTNAVAQALTLGLVIVAAPLAVLVLVGMEHTLQSVAVLGLAAAGVRFCLAADQSTRRRTWVLTLLLAPVATGLRYDAASVLAPLLVAVLVTRGWRPAMGIALAGAAPAVVFAAISAGHGWPLLPTSILLKQRLLAVNLWSWHGMLDFWGGGALTVLVGSPALFVLVLLAAALVVLSPRDVAAPIEREARLLLLVFIGAALIHVQFGRLGWLYRYEAYLMVLGIIANVSVLAHRVPERWPAFGPLQWAGATMLAVLVLHPLGLRGFLAPRELLVDARNVYVHEYQWGQFFKRYPPEGVVLVNSLGAVGYFVDVPLVDAAGMATLDLYPMARMRKWVPEVVSRVAEAHDVRISMVGKPGDDPLGWHCVGGWRNPADEPLDPSQWFFVRDVDTATNLERHLRAFAADDPEHIRLMAFGREPGGCTASP